MALGRVRRGSKTVEARKKSNPDNLKQWKISVPPQPDASVLEVEIELNSYVYADRTFLRSILVFIGEEKAKSKKSNPSSLSNVKPIPAG